MLNIEKQINGSEATVRLEGRLDTTTAPELENELKSFMESITSLVFDFEKLEYISSAGLRVLLTAQKFMSRKMSTRSLRLPVFLTFLRSSKFCSLFSVFF